MNAPHKNKFSTAARCKLIELDWSIKELARQLDHPRETVSKAIRSQRFPLVRAKVAKKLGIKLNQTAA